MVISLEPITWLLSNITMDKPTQHETILKFLKSVPGWVPGFLLSKNRLCDVWVGSRGERSARDLVSPSDCPKGMEDKVVRELGKDLVARGSTIDGFGKQIQNKYVYYRALTRTEINPQEKTLFSQ